MLSLQPKSKSEAVCSQYRKLKMYVFYGYSRKPTDVGNNSNFKQHINICGDYFSPHSERERERERFDFESQLSRVPVVVPRVGLKM